MTTILVDADACPVAMRDILCRAANRVRVNTLFVANQFIALPKSPYTQSIQVPQGFDEADNRIVALVKHTDLVITNDIPLAAQVIEKGARVMTFRGETLNQNNIAAKLTMRDFMDTLRSSGVQTGGPPALSDRDKQSFANKLDRILNKLV